MAEKEAKPVEIRWDTRGERY